MTVFKGFLIITKRNLLMVFMYLAIFLTIGILASGSDSNTSGTGFHAQALTVGVVDHDGGVLSKGLSTYLSQYHTVRQMPDDTAKLQDALFNRNVSYIVTIPKDFKVSCLREHQALPVSKIPGSTDGYYVDQQINTYLNQARVLTDSGYSDKEAAAYILKHADSSSHVTMLKSASSEKDAGLWLHVSVSAICVNLHTVLCNGTDHDRIPSAGSAKANPLLGCVHQKPEPAACTGISGSRMLRLAAHNMDPCFLLLPESIFPVAKDAILYAQQSDPASGRSCSFLPSWYIYHQRRYPDRPRKCCHTWHELPVRRIRST